MKNLKFNIALLFLPLLAPLHAQDSTFFKLKGQMDAYGGLNFENPVLVADRCKISYLHFLLEKAGIII